MKLFIWPLWTRSRHAPLNFHLQARHQEEWPGNGCHLLVLIAVAATLAGCTSARPDLNRTSLEPPIEARLGDVGSPAGPIRIHSGQLISLPLCCPPVELRDAKGKLVRELESTQDPQPIVARTGTYFIVGHDPAGEERVMRLKVVKD